MDPSNNISSSLLLRNGETVLIRPITPDDKQRLLDGFHRLSAKSVYFRFLTSKENLNEKELKYLTEIDFVRHVALVATVPDNNNEKIIGVGRYIQLEEFPEKIAEIAFAVDDTYQNLGVCTILFEYLVTIAQNNGIAKLQADILLENKNMLEVIKHSGLQFNTTIEKGVIHIEFDIAKQTLLRCYT